MQICSSFITIKRVSFVFCSATDEFKKSSSGASRSFKDRARVLSELQVETENTLDWKSICLRVSGFASTKMGLSASQSRDLPIGRDQEESQKLLDQTTAAFLLPQPLDFSGIEDISEIVSTALSGEVPSIGDLCCVARTLGSVRGVLEQLERLTLANEGNLNRYSPLLEILQNCNFLEELEHEIKFCLNCNLSIVMDQASDKLKSIRSQRKKNIQSLESLLKAESSRIFRAGGIENPMITKRRSRMCVAIQPSHKSMLPHGILLDVSSSGATYFMEPRDAVELNNLEVRFSNSEKAEELSILSLLSSELADSENLIRNMIDKVVELDLACARGAFAHWISGVCPVLGDNCVDIEGIQHPLLLESSLSSVSEFEFANSVQLDGGKAAKPGIISERRTDFPVPLNIKIGNNTRVVVISGPNTGGKTATMKTLGLASLMSKAGLYLPAKESPKLPWFDHILADIGDHQSLEHNLSTFSGHILRLCKIMEVVSPQSLVLIDEIGNGTDPSEGMALSTSILQYLVDQAKLAVVTTHYSDLSALKAKDDRFENAAMEFCAKTLLPTYRVLWGSAGTSNALSIAKTIGFDQKLLDRAHQWIDKLMPDKQRERRGLLFQSLLEERKKLEAQAKKASYILSEMKKLYHEILFEAEDVDSREAALKAKESQSVLQELEAAESQIDLIVKNFGNQLKSGNYNRLNSLIKESEFAIETILHTHRLRELPVKESRTYMPKIGDRVMVRGFGNNIATVVETSDDDGNALVQLGKIRVQARKEDMKVIPNGERNGFNSVLLGKGQVQRRPQKQVSERSLKEEAVLGPVVQTSKNTVDLREMRADEAIYHLNMAIASSASNKVLFIIHGMGTGIIKERVIEILSNNSRVTRFEQESPLNYGCTVAYIK